jgi:peroxiredoxin
LLRFSIRSSARESKKKEALMGNVKTAALGMFVAATVMCSFPLWASGPSVGRKVPLFTLKDDRAKDHSFAASLRRNKAVALVFLGTVCRPAKVYGPRLEVLSREFAAKWVAFIGIYPNRQDAVTEMVGFARWRGLTFPILKDFGNKFADYFAAIRTQETFVLATPKRPSSWPQNASWLRDAIDRPRHLGLRKTGSESA